MFSHIFLLIKSLSLFVFSICFYTQLSIFLVFQCSLFPFKIILKQVNRELYQGSLSHTEISINRNNWSFVIKELSYQTLISSSVVYHLWYDLDLIVIFPVKRDLNLQCFYTRHWLSFPFPQTIWFYRVCDVIVHIHWNSLVYSYQFHLRPRCCGHHFGALVYTLPKLSPGDVFPGKRQNLMCHTGTYICIIISLMIPCQSYHWAILQYSVLFQFILLYMYMAFTT